MVSIVSANKRKKKKKGEQQVHRENPITTTPSLSNPYRNNTLSFTNEAWGAVGTVSLATSARTPFDDYVLQTCS